MICSELETSDFFLCYIFHKYLKDGEQQEFRKEMLAKQHQMDSTHLRLSLAVEINIWILINDRLVSKDIIIGRGKCVLKQRHLTMSKTIFNATPIDAYYGPMHRPAAIRPCMSFGD